MPSFDLRGIRCGKYVNTSGTITYTDFTDVGDAMEVNLEMKFAEGRLYAESKLAEYMKLATGGTMSVAVKYIKSAAQQLMFGAVSDSETIATDTVTGLMFGAKQTGKYVGIGFYAPDMIDGTEKYTAVFVTKALFAPPSLSYQTKGENITFRTPTTTGEFLADDSSDNAMLYTAECASEAQAKAWIKAKLGDTSA